MPEFRTFDYGNVMANAANIQNARTQNVLAQRQLDPESVDNQLKQQQLLASQQAVKSGQFELGEKEKIAKLSGFTAGMAQIKADPMNADQYISSMGQQGLLLPEMAQKAGQFLALPPEQRASIADKHLQAGNAALQQYQLQKQRQAGNTPSNVLAAEWHARNKDNPEMMEAWKATSPASRFESIQTLDKNGNPVTVVIDKFAAGGTGVYGQTNALSTPQQPSSNVLQRQNNVSPMSFPSSKTAEERRKQQVELDYAEKISKAKSTGSGAAEIETDLSKKGLRAQTMVALVNQADELLNKASGGYGSLAVAKGAQALGISTDATKANEQLKLISGWMVSNVPRMEGPQSNIDVQNYKVMAAQVGDAAIPIGDRKAALKTLLELQKKYLPANKEKGSDSDGSAPAAAIQYLKKNNSHAVRAQFKAKYGYLP